MFAVRSDRRAFNSPSLVYSSERIAKFFHGDLKIMPSEWIVALEAFSISGRDGESLITNHAHCSRLTRLLGAITAKTPASEVQDLKSTCSEKILKHLREYFPGNDVKKNTNPACRCRGCCIAFGGAQDALPGLPRAYYSPSSRHIRKLAS